MRKANIYVQISHCNSPFYALIHFDREPCANFASDNSRKRLGCIVKPVKTISL